LRLDAGQRPRPRLRGDRGAEEHVDLLRVDAALRRRHRLRVARRQRDLGAVALLPHPHLLGDVGGQHLGLERLAEHDLVDRLADDLLEARHVDARLPRFEIDEALHLRVEEIVGRAVAHPDHLLDPGHADPGEADLGRRDAGLDVGDRAESGARFVRHRESLVVAVHRPSMQYDTAYNPQSAGASGPAFRGTGGNWGFGFIGGTDHRTDGDGGSG
jgi:hypothetical protein